MKKKYLMSRCGTHVIVLSPEKIVHYNDLGDTFEGPVGDYMGRLNFYVGGGFEEISEQRFSLFILGSLSGNDQAQSWCKEA